MAVDLQALRVDLAAALRWAVRLDLHEGVCNHFSVAVPDDDGVVRGRRFLINPEGWHWAEITASSLVLCDAEGVVLEGDQQVEATAFFIHSRIHMHVPDAVAVMHTHMPHATALTLLDQGRLEMCEQNALSFYNRIAYDDSYNGVALDREEGDRIAHCMENCSTLLLAGHGVVATGPNVAFAFNDLYYLERAARFQILARSTGAPLRTLSDDVKQKTSAQMMHAMPQIADRHFRALKRILDREEPEYRD